MYKLVVPFLRPVASGDPPHRLGRTLSTHMSIPFKGVLPVEVTRTPPTLALMFRLHIIALLAAIAVLPLVAIGATSGIMLLADRATLAIDSVRLPMLTGVPLISRPWLAGNPVALLVARAITPVLPGPLPAIMLQVVSLLK